MRQITRTLLAATMSAGLVAAALPQAASAAFSDPQLKCRASISKSSGKFAKTVVKALTGCHKDRDKNGPNSRDCNDLPGADLKVKVGPAGTKLSDSIAAKCTSGAPSDILYIDCPAPCDDDVPAITNFGTLATCLNCLTQANGEDWSDEANGSPTAPINDDVEAGCHKAITKNGGKLFNTVIKTSIKCQSLAEKAGSETVSAACLSTTPTDEAFQKAKDAVADACADLTLPNAGFDPCGGEATVFDMSVCVAQSARNHALELVDQFLQLPNTGPTTTTTTNEPTTTTTSDNTTTTIGGGQDAACPDLGDLTLFSKTSNIVCANNADCTFPRFCNTSTSRCESKAELDSGWNGAGHDADINDQVKAAANLLCPGPASPGCGTCQVTGLSPTSGNCRCANNVLTKCDAPFQNDTECGGNLCECYFGAPFPLAAQGTPVCVSNKFSQDITGTANPDLGSGVIAANLRTKVYLGYSTDLPCPVCGGKCSNDMSGCIFNSDCDGGATCVQDTAGDGIRNGVCIRDPDFHTGAGEACDVDAVNASFPAIIGDTTPGQGGGGYSIDCQPDVGKNVTNQGLKISLVQTTGTTSLSSGLDCDAAGVGTDLCPCMVCSGDQTAPCSSNAECAALVGSCAGAPNNGGVTCTSNTDCAAANVGPCQGGVFKCRLQQSRSCATNADCLGVNVAPCNPQTCTQKGTGSFPQPNFCADDICTDQGGGEGQCNAGPSFKYCDALLTADGKGINACLDDTGCQTGGNYGTCTLLDPADCFLNPIVATGEADPDFPVAGAVFCLPPTANGGVNDSAGLPGPGRVISQGAAKTYCASNHAVEYNPGGVPACP